MKRAVILFAAILLASIGWSQTMKINLKDGTTVKFDMKTVKSIEFTDEESANNQESLSSFLLGTWIIDYHIENGVVVDRDNEYLQFKSDGKFADVIYDEDGVTIYKGYWKLKDNEITLSIAEGEWAGLSFTYTIVESSDKLTLSMWGVTAYLIRVPDDVVDNIIERGSQE